MKVIALSKSKTHSFSKDNCDRLTLIEGLGIEGDAHMGKTTQHIYQAERYPDMPNLRQVHLIHEELFSELSTKGFDVSAGELGENITTSGIDLLSLRRHTILKIGDEVQLEITGLRNPCKQINALGDGLMNAVLDKNDKGVIVRKTGVMSIVLKGGEIKVGDLIKVEFPSTPFLALETV